MRVVPDGGIASNHSGVLNDISECLLPFSFLEAISLRCETPRRARELEYLVSSSLWVHRVHLVILVERISLSS